MKTNMLKFSLIIPVYNTEQYLIQCIESCEKQDIACEEYEIIAINDGSTDNSLCILKQLQNKYGNIVIISLENSGLSAARNTGLNVAKGQYIWFIDSDDWIECNLLGYIYKELSENNLECIKIGFKKIFNSGVSGLLEDKYNKEKSSVLTGVQMLNSQMSKSFYAWSFIYDRLFFIENGFIFKDRLIYEDLQLIPKILLKAKRISYLHSHYYNYRQRDDSIVHNVTPRMIDSLFFILEDYTALISKLTDKQQKHFCYYLTEHIKVMLLVLLSKLNTDSENYISQFILRYPHLKIYNRMNINEKICILLYNLSNKAALFILRHK